jgi:hypothetical protein
MGELFLLILGGCAFVVLASTVVRWVLPASSLGEWTEEEKEKARKNRWLSIK